MMGSLASRFPKVGVIQLLDSGILMGLADGVILIQVIQHLRPQCADVGGIAHIAWLLRLSAAVYAAAGARHDFYKVIFALARLYIVHNLARVPSPLTTAMLSV